MYFMISLTALLAAIWVGLVVCGPLRRSDPPPDQPRAQEVSKRQPEGRAAEQRGEGDLRRLSMNFNTMTQRAEAPARPTLVTANEQLPERRRFMEAVLSGVSAGVIGLDSQDRITLVSRSADEAAGPRRDRARRQEARRTPAGVRRHARPEPRSTRQGARPRQQSRSSSRGEERKFAVRVTRESARAATYGSVAHLRRRHRARRRPSAPRPGPTSRGASPTRSRTR